MQKRAGILFIDKNSLRIFLKWENGKWTVPTFIHESSVISDSQDVIQSYGINDYKLIPIELYLSKDQGFAYGSYICMTEKEFGANNGETYAWASINDLPKNIHNGLKSTLQNKIIQTKIDTIVAMSNTYEQ